MSDDLLKVGQHLLHNQYAKRHIATYIREDLERDHKDKVDIAIQEFTKFLKDRRQYSAAERTVVLLDSIQNNEAYFEGSELVLYVLGKVLMFKEEVPIQSVIGTFADVLPFMNQIDNVKTAGDLLSVLCESDLFDINKVRGELKIKPMVELHEDTIIKINRTGYLPPMLIKPNLLTCNQESPVGGSNILKPYNQHKGDIGLGYLDIANHVPLCIDEVMLDYEEIWDEEKYEFKIASGQKTVKEVEDIKKQYILRKEGQADILNLIIDLGNHFHLAHKNDARVRMYCQGYELNYQGTQWQKALIDIDREHATEIPDNYFTEIKPIENMPKIHKYKAITLKGNRCKRFAVDTEYCKQHQNKSN